MALIFFASLSLQFLAFTAGGALLVWAFHKGGNGSAIATFIGTITTLFSFLFILISIYFGIKDWMTGAFKVERPSVNVEELKKIEKMDEVLHQLQSSMKSQAEHGDFQ